MNKTALFLGALNLISLILSCVILSFVLWPVLTNGTIFDYFTTVGFFSFLLFVGLPVLFFFSNLYSIYKLYRNPTAISRNQKVIYPLIAHLPFWIVLYFFGYFTASSVMFPVIAIIVAGAIFLILRRINIFVTVVTILITVSLIIFAITTGFEEDYCLTKAAQVSNPDQFVKLTQDDAGPIDSTPGQEVSKSFREHVRCHKYFDYWVALKEKYLFTK